MALREGLLHILTSLSIKLKGLNTTHFVPVIHQLPRKDFYLFRKTLQYPSDVDFLDDNTIVWYLQNRDGEKTDRSITILQFPGLRKHLPGTVLLMALRGYAQRVHQSLLCFPIDYWSHQIAEDETDSEFLFDLDLSDSSDDEEECVYYDIVLSNSE
jgi:hypothetical protein